MKRKIAAILASDVAGYSRLVAEDEEGTLARLEAYRTVFYEFVQKAGGRVFNTAGDAILAEFPSAVEATRCAIDIQESIRTRNMGYLPSKQMLFRIGITIGDVVEREGGDLLGDGVNIAARLEGLAEPGGICVSRNIYEQVANKLSVPFHDIGENEVKNMPQKVHAFRIDFGGGAVAVVKAAGQPVDSAPRRASVQDRRASGGIGIAMGLGVLGLAAGFGAVGAWIWARPAATAPQAELKPITPPVPLPPATPPVAETLKQEALKPQTPKRTAVAPPQKPQPPAKPVAPGYAGIDPAPSPAERQAIVEIAPENTPPPGEAKPPRIAAAQQPPEPEPPKPEALKPEPAKPKLVLPPGTTPAQAYAQIARSGGIVPEAATAPELYHNARSYEARGDVNAARRDYMKLAQLPGDFVDPHIRFAAFLRAQDGKGGAKPVYEKLAGEAGNRAAVLVHALQFDESERRKRLLAFISANPDFAAAHYLMSEEYAGGAIGVQTIYDRKQQFEALKQFVDAHDKGQLARFFLDQSILADWLDKARGRMRALEHYLKTAKLDPVAQFMRSNTSWIVSLSLPEPATAIQWRVGEKDDFKSTGELRSIDQRTGKPMPNPSFELPGSSPRVRLFVRYNDASGQAQGPFPIDFEPRTELVRSQRDILQRFSSNWVAINTSGNASKLLYFTHLVSYRCAIARVELLFDDSPLSMQLRLPPCNPADPHAVPHDARVFMPMPSSAKKVTVTVNFADGGKPEKRTFQAP